MTLPIHSFIKKENLPLDDQNLKKLKKDEFCLLPKEIFFIILNNSKANSNNHLKLSLISRNWQAIIISYFNQSNSNLVNITNKFIKSIPKIYEKCQEKLQNNNIDQKIANNQYIDFNLSNSISFQEWENQNIIKQKTLLIEEIVTLLNKFNEDVLNSHFSEENQEIHPSVIQLFNYLKTYRSNQLSHSQINIHKMLNFIVEKEHIPLYLLARIVKHFYRMPVLHPTRFDSEIVSWFFQQLAKDINNHSFIEVILDSLDMDKRCFNPWSEGTVVDSMIAVINQLIKKKNFNLAIRIAKVMPDPSPFPLEYKFKNLNNLVNAILLCEPRIPIDMARKYLNESIELFSKLKIDIPSFNSYHVNLLQDPTVNPEQELASLIYANLLILIEQGFIAEATQLLNKLKNNFINAKIAQNFGNQTDMINLFISNGCSDELVYQFCLHNQNNPVNIQTILSFLDQDQKNPKRRKKFIKNYGLYAFD